ncbi:MAG: helix-turn-helix transcriptional regulator [Alphaproteobacteria bacterium]
MISSQKYIRDYVERFILLRKTIGKQLKSLREFHGLTTAQLAKEIGYQASISELKDYENGRYNIISLEMLVILAHYYGKTVRIVFDDDKTAEKHS